ncbi:MAG: hypothetical protein IKL43_09095 [Alistipes sp.]|nr:hypothetical protein [Alistipes sp.]
MEKVVRDGKVAVVTSIDGLWSAFEHNKNIVEILIFHPLIVEKVLAREAITEQWMIDTFGIKGYSCDGNELIVEWVEQGEEFFIDTYDGMEEIRFRKYIDLFTA